MYTATIGLTRYSFPTLRDLLAKASPPRSGDRLAGIAAASAAERVAAQTALADLPLAAFLNEAIVPYDEDEVTRLILDRHDTQAFAPVAALTVGGLRDWLLSDAATTAALTALAPGLTPEIVAAVSKLCRNQDLIAIAAKTSVVTRFRNTIGLPGRLSSRLQPNHPTDDPRGVLASIIDGLLLGSGDAVIGINPATDNPERCRALLHLIDDVRERLAIPTQSCVLTHVTTTLGLIQRGAPVDLVFQSIGGTEALNRSFGIDLAILREAREAALSLRRGTIGDNVMYFETGQGSALSANAHHGCDQQTLEARAYGVAREFAPLLVNSVVGFIGPEYLYDGKQITRATTSWQCGACSSASRRRNSPPGSTPTASAIRRPRGDQCCRRRSRPSSRIGEMSDLARRDEAFWLKLRAATPARIGLNRTGTALATSDLLAFQRAHAEARDAVHERLDSEALAARLRRGGIDIVQLHSAAPDRATYLARPDLGRRLDDASRERLDDASRERLDALPRGHDLVFVIADRLSARAVERHAEPVLSLALAELRRRGLRIGRSPSSARAGSRSATRSASRSRRSSSRC